MQGLSIGRGYEKPEDLAGEWLIHPIPASWGHGDPPLENDPGWRTVLVPGAWEACGLPPAAEGPFWYRRRFAWAPRDGESVHLRFHGVSTRCLVCLNGRCLGEHEGIWDGFEFEVTGDLAPGANELAILVQKAGDALPLRQSLAGFLPDVCVLFGGPWRPVELVRKRGLTLQDLHLRADADSGILHLTISGERMPGSVHPRLCIAVLDPAGREAAGVILAPPDPAGRFTLAHQLQVPSHHWWDPDEPNLYTVTVEAEEGGRTSDLARRRFGWRSLRLEGSRILLNGRPVLLRGLLHWGWYPETVAPTPARAQIKAEILQAKEAGFNLIKHCLYVPVEDFYDLADELGVLLWQELPLWLPEMTPAVKEKVYRQYPAIMERLHSHPSLILWSLGCELDAAADGDFLARLYATARETAGDALIRDNSGSGECYGGLLNEHADFYDYHFYTDPHFYRPLMDRFAADWRERKPWLYGEFCDQDEARDIVAVREANGGGDPWWLTPPAVADLKRENRGSALECRRLAEAGLLSSYEDLLASSRRKGLAYRRAVLEAVRQYDPLAGYVLTSLRDTPLSTSAFFDDLGRVKHDPADWRRFNADTVLTLAWDNRRDWIGGGDRLRFWDHYNHLCGRGVRAHLTISHFGREPLLCERLVWHLSAASGHVLASGSAAADKRFAPGTMGEAAIIEFEAPAVPEITPCLLLVELAGTLDGHPATLTNSWQLWLYPPSALAHPNGTVLHDPYGLLPGCDLPRGRGAPGGGVLVTTSWDGSVEGMIAAGGRVLYVQPGDGPLPNVAGPFWREALQIFADPYAFPGFTGDGFCGLQWYSLATDRSFDQTELAGFFAGRAGLRALLRRLDLRQYLVREYAVEITLGGGRAILTTLRLAGGLGDQASDLGRTVAGQALLAGLCRTLMSESG